MMAATLINRKHCGFSLIEIMIALTVGLVLLGGVVQVYIGNKQTYRIQDQLGRLQENARYAMYLLTNELRSAGYQGCASLDSVTPNVIALTDPDSEDSLTESVTNAMTGYHYAGSTWSPVLPAPLTSLPLAGTDVFASYKTESCGAYLNGNMSSQNANVQVLASNTCGLVANDAIVISDCSAVDIFRATNVSSGTGTQTIAHAANANSSVNLSKAYGPDAQLMRVVANSYFISNGAGGVPALWRYDHSQAAGTSNPQEIVEGVENMQILFGVDTDADGVANIYSRADVVEAGANWANTVSARIFLLMRTITEVATEIQTYSFMGAASTPADRFLRREVTTTINLRNRGA